MTPKEIILWIADFFAKRVPCEMCKGHGYLEAQGGVLVECPFCDGTGKIKVIR